MTEDICSDLAPGTVLTFWSTSDLKFFIQITQKTTGQFGEYYVFVEAERYDIRSMDFEACRFETPGEADNEAQRLSLLFTRANFRDRRWQRQYLEQHPQKTVATEEEMAWLEKTARRCCKAVESGHQSIGR